MLHRNYDVTRNRSRLKFNSGAEYFSSNRLARRDYPAEVGKATANMVGNGSNDIT